MAALQGSILVTGGNRGIGLALIKHLVGLPVAPKHIFATCRSLKAENARELTALAQKHSNLHLVELDVTNTSQLPGIVKEVGSIVGESGLNIIINNAAILAPLSLQDVTVDSMMKSYEVNTIAPLMISKYFLPLLQQAVLGNKATGKSVALAIIVNISSLVASVDDNSSGGLYPYRSSKTALNMVTKSLSVDLAKDGIVAIAINPGRVKTELKSGTITSAESASSLIKVISSVDTSGSGCFFHYDGKILPW